MRKITSITAASLFGVIGLVGVGQAAGTKVAVPLHCDHGPGGQKENIVVTAPVTAAEGSTYKVRIDGTNSGKISHTGLNYIYNMTYTYGVPQGTQVVAGSMHIVADTGTPNVRPGAKITHKGGNLEVVLPARVDDGSNYTPPSFEFELKVTAAAGASIAQGYKGYRVTANAFLVGDVNTACDPVPKPFTVATTKVVGAEVPAAPPAQ